MPKPVWPMGAEEEGKGHESLSLKEWAGRPETRRAPTVSKLGHKNVKDIGTAGAKGNRAKLRCATPSLWGMKPYHRIGGVAGHYPDFPAIPIERGCRVLSK